MSFVVLLLYAVSGYTLGSTTKPLQEMNIEDAVLTLSKQMEARFILLQESVEEGKKIQEELLVEIKRVERNYLEDKKEQSSKLEEVLIKMSDVEKASQMSIDAVSDRLRIEKEKLFVMNNDLLLKVFELQNRDFQMFEKIANVQNEAKSDRVRADTIQVRLNETANMTHSCLASQTQMEEAMKKNMETLNSSLSTRMGNVENSLGRLRKDLDSTPNRQDSTLTLNVHENTNDIGQLKQEISRFQTLCSPPCENGGQCIKNVCNCTPSFTGDGCQHDVCSPPCANGGQCVGNNTCKCVHLFFGDRCKDQCGVDVDNDGYTGGGNTNSNPLWPWVAAVYGRTNSIELICGGSVIHRRFVLTSAPCAENYGTGGLSVAFGLGDQKNGAHLRKYGVRSVHIHHKYRLGPLIINYDYGIALLKLEEPIPFGPSVKPVCLPPAEIPPDETFYQPKSTATYVYLESSIQSSENVSLTVLNLTILSQEECRAFNPSPDLTFCAGSSSTTCPTRGSPVMQHRLGGGGTRIWTQVGFQNPSYGCERMVIPRLDRLRAWVEEIIEASSRR